MPSTIHSSQIIKSAADGISQLKALSAGLKKGQVLVATKETTVDGVEIIVLRRGNKPSALSSQASKATKLAHQTVSGLLVKAGKATNIDPVSKHHLGNLLSDVTKNRQHPVKMKVLLNGLSHVDAKPVNQGARTLTSPAYYGEQPYIKKLAKTLEVTRDEVEHFAGRQFNPGYLRAKLEQAIASCDADFGPIGHAHPAVIAMKAIEKKMEIPQLTDDELATAMNDFILVHDALKQVAQTNIDDEPASDDGQDAADIGNRPHVPTQGRNSPASRDPDDGSEPELVFNANQFGSVPIEDLAFANLYRKHNFGMNG